MTVTFADIVLADGESRTAKVASGIALSGDVVVDPLEFLRADWAVPVARGNRIITLPMIISLPPQADFEGALIEALMYFSNLPAEGVLKIQHGAALVTFSQAVCGKVKVRDLEGIQNDVALTFACGMPTNSTLSPLAQMSAFYPNVISLTGLTGGGSGNLDGQVTTDVATGRWVVFYLGAGALALPHNWVLMAWTDETEDAAAGRVLPDDFDDTENPKFWQRVI